MWPLEEEQALAQYRPLKKSATRPFDDIQRTQKDSMEKVKSVGLMMELTEHSTLSTIIFIPFASEPKLRPTLLLLS